MRYTIIQAHDRLVLWDLCRNAAHPFAICLSLEGWGGEHRQFLPRPCNAAYVVPVPIKISQVATTDPIPIPWGIPMTRERRLIVLNCIVMASPKNAGTPIDPADLIRVALDFGRPFLVIADEVHAVLGMAVADVIGRDPDDTSPGWRLDEHGCVTVEP